MKLKGLREFDRRIKSLPGKLETEMTEVIHAAAYELEGDAKDNCPVDTGRLRGSIVTVPGKMTAVVGTSVNYAVFVEYGKKGRPGKPFLKPAYLKATKELNKDLKLALIRVMKK